MTKDDRSHIEELAHLYVDGAFDRRELLMRVARVTGGIATATVALESLGFAADSKDENARTADDVRVPAKAHDLEVMDVQFPGTAGTIFAHLARPRHATPRHGRGQATDADTGRHRVEALPAIIVIHENRGLNEHIRDVTRRAARAGFVALGIDLLSRFGGTPEDPEEALRLYQQTTADARLEDLWSALAYLQGLDGVQGDKLGAVGFCAGGGNCWNLVLNTGALAAAVVYYGTPVPPLDALSRLTSPVLAIYAELDRNLTRGILPAILRLEELQKPFGFHIYEGTRHAFHNDTGANYDPAAARDAWSETTSFFQKYLNDAS